MSALCRYCCKSRRGPAQWAKTGNNRIQTPGFVNQYSLFTPNLRKLFFAPCPKIFFQQYAKIRLMQCSKQHLYSSTSSAATSSVCGPLRPSAFAVLRLLTRPTSWETLLETFCFNPRQCPNARSLRRQWIQAQMTGTLLPTLNRANHPQ